MPRLLVEKGKDKGKSLRLKENGIFLVGRDMKTNLRLTDLQTSRRHFKLTCRLGEFRIEDLDSSNGTWVNGRRVRSTTLSWGDKVELGETLIFFLEDEGDSGELVRKAELTGQEIAGYRLGRLLGRGGMGTVYEAIQISLERKVAFKVLAKELAEDAQFVERFAAEARAAGALNHPNIVQVYDVGQATLPGRPTAVRYYSMEYMAKGSVDDTLRREGRLSFARALPILFDAARGLEYAERHGVIHRDIKPQNLFISEEGIVKIGDLGIAQRRRHDDDRSKRDELVSGSPHYMAPEQARGEQIDHRADLYALGVSLYEMLSGDVPFDGSSVKEVILKHLNDPPPPLSKRAPDAPDDAIALVERLMEKEPARRMPSARALLSELVGLAQRCELPSDTRIRIEAAVANAQEVAKRETPVGEPVIEGAPDGPVLPTTETRQLPASGAQAGGGLGRTAVIAIALAVFAMLAGLSGFVVVRKLNAARAEKRRAAEEQVDALRSALAEGRLQDDAALEAARREVLGALERSGHLDLVAQAKGLLDEGALRLQKAAAEKAEQRARGAFDALKARADKARAASPATPDAAAELAAVAKELAALAAAEAATAAGKEAQDLAKRTGDEAVRASEAIERRRERDAAAEQAFLRRQAAVESLASQGRYRDAREHVAELSAEWKDLATTPARARQLNDAIDTAARKALEARLVEVRRFIEARSFDDARRTLSKLRRELDGALAREADDELEKVDAAEKALSEQAQKRAIDADRPLLLRALGAAKQPAEERRYADAARELEAILSQLTTPGARGIAERRAHRLRHAQSAVDRVLDTIRARGRQSGIKHDFPQAAAQGCPAVAVDGTTIFFEIKKDVTLPLNLPVVQAEELHDWAARTIEKNDPGGWVTAAALALELDRSADADADLRRLRAMLATKKDLLADTQGRELEESQADDKAPPDATPKPEPSPKNSSVPGSQPRKPGDDND